MGDGLFVVVLGSVLVAARLVRVEWSWRAHVVAVAGSAVLTSAYAVVRSL